MRDFLSEGYNRWLKGPDHEWIQASAAGIVGEAMTALSASPRTRWVVCAGWMHTFDRPMLYRRNSNGSQLEPARDIADAQPSYLEDALITRRLVFEHFLFEWLGPPGSWPCDKSLSVPFLLREV